MLLLSVTAGLSVARAQSREKSPTPGIAFLHVNIVPMDREGVLEDQTVVVQDGRIAQIGSSEKTRPPAGARRIEGRRMYMIPGLTDAHVHLLSTTELPLYLVNGVTTVFNLDGRPQHLLWRKQIADGELLGPTIFTTGPIFGQAHTAEQAVHMVDEQAAAGYDGVKIYNQVSKAEYPALTAEAKRKNMLLIGHVAREPDFEMTIQAGQSIAHLEEFTYTYFNPLHDDKNSHIVYDESKIPAVAKATAEAGISVIPTLYTYRDIVEQATNLREFLKRPELKYLAPWILAGLQPNANRYFQFPERSHAQLQTSLAFQRKLIKALFDDGVPLMAGTDATDLGPVAGFAIHDELQEYVNDGLSPFQALQTATVNPARYLHGSAEFGSIQAGKRADLVLLRQNPLSDISATRKIEGVMVRGRWFDHAELARMLESIPSAYRREEKQLLQDMARDPLKAQRYLDENDPMRRLAFAAMSDLAADKSGAPLRQIVLKIRQVDPKSTLASEESINNLGYSFLNQKKFSEGVAVLKMNIEDFPKSANAYDSYAEALFDSGDAASAVENYKRALEIDPKYPNAEFAAKFVADHAPAH